jgi:peptidoglycan L-alanyl-D-glutamate endopeptidase CwlK
MPTFSNKSKARLKLCHGGIITVMNKAIEIVDFSILSTYRGEAEQTKLYVGGLSKLQYPHSKHNWMPSHGIDVAPYPIDFENRERFVYLAGIILGIASQEIVNLRWGGDWDMDNDLHDQTFMDLGHFEVV